MLRLVGATCLVLGAILAVTAAIGAESNARRPSETFQSPSGNIRCVIGQGTGKANDAAPADGRHA